MSEPHALRPAATTNQETASDPKVSSWVTASAGTGKTQVLTDRVLRLLLAGARPSAILCLTFTRAAAAVMKLRVTEALARWATAPDALLAEELRLMRPHGMQPVTGAEVRSARSLFAEVLDAPGGLRIITIHAFCESLLKRFPLESRVEAHFQVMDERTAAEHLEAARDRVLERARTDKELQVQVGGVTARVNEQRFGELMLELSKHRDRLQRLVSPDLATAFARIRHCLGLADGENAKSILTAACSKGAFDELGLERACRELNAGADKYKKRADLMRSWLAAEALARADRFEEYRSAYFGKDGEQFKELLSKKARDASPDVGMVLDREADRVGKVAERLRKAEVYESTACLVAFGKELLEEYEAGKHRHALLDYDDLILKAQALLERPGVAPWVLYKLDGGIDHILIDEAQDTSPGQWRVIRAIANEFFSGTGAYEGRNRSPRPPNPRTIFAVGDAKQSIYSFLQADPESFKAMREYFGRRVDDADATWKPQELADSFRSVEVVLNAVDSVFAEGLARQGLTLAEQHIRHLAHRVGQAGYVELWPEVREEETETPSAWEPPVEQGHQRSAVSIVAERIAATVAGWIGREMLPARARPVRPGDILILVQRRGTFVEEVIRALKGKNVAVAGIDRMLITEQLPVQDLMALGSFALLPEDNLTLATVLKGPLVGLSEELLFDLAAGREGSLWRVLRDRAAERPEFTAAEQFLSAVRAEADFTTPHAFYANLLARGGRRQILTRLGPEANDPIDEFLARAFEYERAHAPSLQGFLDWIARGEVVVARDLEVGRDEVRVLTVHGAKGLQAPIVFLADTFFIGNRDPLLHWRLQDDQHMPLWVPAVKNADTIMLAERAAAAARREDEYHRLLYVAMTRAEDRLIVCGFAPKKPKTESKREERVWYSLIAAGLARMGPPATVSAEGVQRWVTEQSAPVRLPKSAATEGAADSALPEWTQRAAPTEPAPKSPLAPSRPHGVEPPAFSPLAAAETSAGIRRGVLIHRLLQLLPAVAPAQRAAAAARFLAANAAEFSAGARDEMAASTLAVLAQPDFAHLFGPNSRAEVPVVGAVRLRKDQDDVLAGQIDRLVVSDTEVLIVDYKTHRPAPASLADVPPVYRQQMAAYRAALAAIYPGRAIRCALLWTDGPRLMELPAAHLSVT